MKKKIRNPNKEDTAFYDKITKIECSIMDKIAILKKAKNFPSCSHFLDL